MLQTFIFSSLAVVFMLALSNCGLVEPERKLARPESTESDLPWNGLRDGEALGQFGAFQRR